MYNPDPNHISPLQPHAPVRLRDLFRSVAQQYRYGIYLNLQKHICMTHRELAVLRRYAELVSKMPNLVIHVYAAADRKKGSYIVDSLIHLGVSIGQVCIKPTDPDEAQLTGVWLLVAQR